MFKSCRIFDYSEHCNKTIYFLFQVLYILGTERQSFWNSYVYIIYTFIDWTERKFVTGIKVFHNKAVMIICKAFFMTNGQLSMGLSLGQTGQSRCDTLQTRITPSEKTSLQFPHTQNLLISNSLYVIFPPSQNSFSIESVKICTRLASLIVQD